MSLLPKSIRLVQIPALICAAAAATSCKDVSGPNLEPVTSIASPTNEQVFIRGEIVVFEGSSSDPEDGALSGDALTWFSSIDGDIGTGVSFSKSDLSLGEHSIVLTGQDTHGVEGTASVSLTIEAENQAPTVTIASPTDGGTYTAGGAITMQGTATDPEDGDLTGDALVWTSSLAGPFGTGVSFTKTDLGEGEHIITLTATDAAGASGAASITITVTAPEGSPTVTITSPGNGTTVTAGATVTFEGFATDPEDGDLTGNALVWSSSVDGRLGNGLSITKNDLLPGPHVVTLTATDAAGETGSTSISLTINQPPTATITSPANDVTFTSGDDIAFAGTATDLEDGDLTGDAVVWTSSVDGHLGTGTSISKSDLSAGQHTITLTVTDAAGATGSASIVLTINQRPVASITSPNDGGTFTVGDDITMQGSASDPEDGDLTGDALAWTSSLAGTIGTGASVTKTNLVEGEHVITLTATDAGGADGAVSITITVKAEEGSPTVTISSPASETTVTAGATVTFVGSAKDPEDGDLTGNALKWSSSEDGPLGTGLSITKNNLSAGSHVVTLTATDAAGNTGSTSITLTINQPPTANIGSPADGATFTFGDAIAFAGTATDDEDGTLTGNSLAWSSSADDELGSGTSLSRSDLSTGQHTITLTATDAAGATGSASIVVTINARPVPSITSPDDGSTFTSGDNITMRGTATDPEDGDLTGDALAWISSLDGQLGTGTSITMNDLSAGQHTITLTATDAANATGSTSIVLTINQPPVVAITSPADGSTLTAGDDITMQGAVTNLEDKDLTGDALVWTSSLDGEIGTGTSLTMSNLSDGQHTITLTATDAAGATGSASIDLTINQRPVASISSPDDGSTFTSGDNITMLGEATDPEDGDLTGIALAWNSSLDGQIGTGTSITMNNLSAGQHTITLTATDAANATGSTSIVLTINEPPVVSITSPDDGSKFTSGDNITMQGTATDSEDGDLTGNALVWTSSADGQIGTGTSISRSDLSTGEHTITLTATDSDGATSTAAVTVSVVPPEVTVTVTAGSSIGKTDREVEITLTLDLSQIGLPVSGVRGIVSWDDDEQDDANKAAYVVGSAGSGAWSSSLASQSLVAKGKLQFAAISLTGIADDTIITLTFKVKPSDAGDMVFIPNLTQLDVIDAQTGTITTLQDIGVVFKNISVTVDVQD